MKKKPKAHWIGLGAWCVIVAAAVAACSGGTGAKALSQQATVGVGAAAGSTAAAQR